MAQIQPNYLDPTTPPSERKVYQALRDRLPPDWLVLHSRRLISPVQQGRGRAFESEIDFLVFQPSLGIIGLEVKGGGVARGPDGWASVDGQGKRHPIKDPGKQAQNAVHDLKKYLRGHDGSRTAAESLHFEWAVVFPDVEAPRDLGPDLPRALVIDQTDLRAPKEAIEHAFRFYARNGTPMSPDVRRTLLAVLAPRLQLVPSLSTRLDDEAPILLRLTEEQIEVLDLLAEFPRIGVEGSAGTGKTVIATEKARRMAELGQRVLFLCYNRPLADSLAEKAAGYTVKNFHTLCRELSRSAGLRFNPPRQDDESQAFWETQAPELLIQALDTYPDERYDAVVVDEGQDFREYWWLAVEKLLKDPKTGHLWVFYDPQQNLYGGGPTEALNLRAAKLKWNCRNTERIAEYAFARVGLSPKLKPGTPEGTAVREVACTTEQEMVELVRKTLHQLVIEERLPTDKIVVLSPRGQASRVWWARQLGNLTLIEFPKKPAQNEVPFASLQRFKGLEADVVILCDVKEGDAACGPRHLYVGTSRAKHLLVVAKYA